MTRRERIENRIARRLDWADGREKKVAAGGVAIEGTGDYVSVTFAEKPERTVLDALKAAGFHWSGGSWHGYRASLPALLRAHTPKCAAWIAEAVKELGEGACICGQSEECIR